MLPKLAPTKNQPVTDPVIVMCLLAKFKIVGNVEAMPSPNNTVPPHNAASEDGNKRITAIPANARSKSTIMITRGRTRVAIGIEAMRATMNAAQNAEFK